MAYLGFTNLIPTYGSPRCTALQAALAEYAAALAQEITLALTLTLALALALTLTLTLTPTLNLTLILSLILSLTRCRLFGRLARCVDLRRNRHRRERRGHAKLCGGLCGHTQLDNGRPVRARPAHQRYAPGA